MKSCFWVLAHIANSQHRDFLPSCSCALAASAQFYPKKYPDNYWVLLFCVVCYGLASLAQNVIFGHVGGDLFFQSRMKASLLLLLSCS